MASTMTLLKKKHLSGRDLGRLDLANLAITQGNVLAPSHAEPLYTMEEMWSWVQKIDTPQDAFDYDGYISIHEWVSIRLAKLETTYHQSQLAAKTLMDATMDAILTENVSDRLERIPVCMTRKQYNETMEAGKESFFKAPNGGEAYSCVLALILNYICHFVDLLREEPEAENPLRPFREKYSSETLPDDRAIQLTQLIVGRGAVPTAPITKWAALESDVLFQLYPADTGGLLFCMDYPHLADAALRDIDATFFHGTPDVINMAVGEWGKPIISYRQLYDLDFYGCREAANSAARIFADNPRALRSGVAIIEEGTDLGNGEQITGGGYYRDPDIHDATITFGLESYTDAVPESMEYVQNVVNARSLFYKTYHTFLAHNAAMDMIGKQFSVPEMVETKMDMGRVQQLVDAVCFLSEKLGDILLENPSQTMEIQARKKAAYEKLLCPLDLSGVKLKRKNISEAREMLQDYKAFEPQHIKEFERLIFDPQRDSETKGG